MIRQKVLSGIVPVDPPANHHGGKGLDDFLEDDLFSRWQPVATQIFNLKSEEIMPLYQRLEDELNSSMKLGHQADALERAETNARAAFRLFLNADSNLSMWKLGHERTMSAFREVAGEKLQQEKDLKLRSKAITEADITAKMTDMFPDEVVRAEQRRLQFESVKKDLEHLVKMWSDKIRSLQVLVGKGR